MNLPVHVCLCMSIHPCVYKPPCVHTCADIHVSTCLSLCTGTQIPQLCPHSPCSLLHCSVLVQGWLGVPVSAARPSSGSGGPGSCWPRPGLPAPLLAGRRLRLPAGARLTRSNANYRPDRKPCRVGTGFGLPCTEAAAAPAGPSPSPRGWSGVRAGRPRGGGDRRGGDARVPVGVLVSPGRAAGVPRFPPTPSPWAPPARRRADSARGFMNG